ncbi:hypothetical protein F4809DRAFT_632312 [Biscogniauxia mediterranea]|nr:hypothetical protein F4809DRAFT_632312 [Biscogniauxia mediterranea]
MYLTYVSYLPLSFFFSSLFWAVTIGVWGGKKREREKKRKIWKYGGSPNGNFLFIYFYFLFFIFTQREGKREREREEKRTLAKKNTYKKRRKKEK